MNALIGGPWLQMTYWSLAIEFQYYIFIGLLFPLIARPGLIAAVLTDCIFAGGAFLFAHSDQLLPHHLPIFLFGVMVFRFKCLHISKWELAIGIATAFTVSMLVDGFPHSFAALLAAVTILTVNRSAPLVTFLGTISYSLYLVHVFVGQIVLGEGAPEVPAHPILKWVLPLVSVALSVLLAWLLYILVESPAKRLSARLTYGDSTPAR